MSTPPWMVPPPVYTYVGEAHNKFMNKGDSLMGQAVGYAQQLANFGNYLQPIVEPVNFEFNGQLAGFQRPMRPSLDYAGFDTRPVPEPARPAAFDVGDVVLPEIPVFNTPAPVASDQAKPDRPLVAMPVRPDRPALPALPAEPDFGSMTPAPVTLQQLNIPQFQPIVLPTFTATRPAFNPPQLSQAGWQFTPEQYVSDLLARIKSRVERWMDGEEALPAAIERALFDRGRARIDTETDAEVEQAFDDFAARGFSAPPGMLAGRADAIRHQGQQRIAEFNRDAMLKSFDEALANMRLAVTEGIRLEGTTINLHMEMQRLELASATHLRDTGIALLNAAVAEFNALNEGYRTDAMVYETRLKAALSTLEESRLRLEAERLKGEINEQSVRLYVAAWEGVRTAASVYESRVNAMSAQAEMAKIPIEMFAEETRAFEAIWNAHGKEWDGYRAAVEADTSKATFFRAMADAYVSRVQGAVAGGNLAIEKQKLRLGQRGHDIDAYRADIQKMQGLLDADRNRIAALASKAQAQAAMYRADADIETAASAATDRTFSLGLEKAKAKSAAELESARIQSNENVQLLQLLMEAQRTLAQVFSQMGSSMMSAMSYSASLSGGVSSSTSFSYSGEI